MDNEPYHDLTHNQACDLLADLYSSANNEVKREFTIPNGRIADLMIMTPDRDFVIIEVKSFGKTCYLDDALRRFGEYSHRVWLAIPHLPLAISRSLRLRPGMPEPRERVGIMSVEHDALVIYRQAQRRQLSPLVYEQIYTDFCTR